MSPKPELGYWAIRGLAQPARLMFAYANVEFVDMKYEVKKDSKGEWDLSDWFNKKYTLGLELPNLPYIVDEDVKVTESMAVLRHIARKYKPELLGKSLKEQAEVDMFVDHVFSMRQLIVGVAYCSAGEYEKKFKNMKDEGLPKFFKTYEDVLKNKTYLLGSQLCVADFHLYELLDQVRLWIPGCLDAYPNLQKFCTTFEQIPNIQKYMKSDKFMSRPINNTMANFK